MRLSPKPPLVALVFWLGGVVPCAAHFQEIIPSADVLPDGGRVTLDLAFAHPFEGRPVMQMERPQEVGLVLDGQRRVLTDRLVETPRDGAMAWTLDADLPEPGAAVFYVIPKPYWEAAEGRYIRHYAKVIVDSFASGTGWDAMVGLPVEIRPLTRPTGLWTGSLFTGVVMQAGAPVPFARIEAEYRNTAGLVAPNDAFVTQVLTADANGTFSVAMPLAGWWGFAALVQAAAPMTSPDGREVPVEEGAVIWVHTTSAGN